MSAFKIFAPLAMGLAACSGGPAQGETAATGARAYDCPASDAARASGFVESILPVQRAGLSLNAVLSRPQDGPVNAVVVFLHGYTGSRDEIAVRGDEGMFLRAARAFARQGIASVRFDFAGSGKSDGAWADTTFDSQAADTGAVLRALRDMPGFETLPLHFLGFSQGGLVGLKVAADDPSVQGIVLWNPVLNPFQTFGHIFGAKVLNAGLTAARAGDLDVPVPGARLKAGFFRGIESSDPVSNGAAYAGPVLIVAGTSDTIADEGPANARAFRKDRKARTEILTVRAGHAFGVTSGTGVIDRVIACSGGFIAETSGIGAGFPDLQ